MENTTILNFMQIAQTYAAERTSEYAQHPQRLYRIQEDDTHDLIDEFTDLETMAEKEPDHILPRFVGLMLFFARNGIVLDRKKLIDILSYSLTFFSVETFDVITALCMITPPEWERLLERNLQNLVCDEIYANDTPDSVPRSLLYRHSYFAPRCGKQMSYDDPWIVAAIVYMAARGDTATSLAYTSLIRMVPTILTIADQIHSGMITLHRMRRTEWVQCYDKARSAAGLQPPDDAQTNQPQSPAP